MLKIFKMLIGDNASKSMKMFIRLFDATALFENWACKTKHKPQSMSYVLRTKDFTNPKLITMEYLSSTIILVLLY